MRRRRDLGAKKFLAAPLEKKIFPSGKIFFRRARVARDGAGPPEVPGVPSPPKCAHMGRCAHMCAHLPMCAHFGGEGTPGTSGGPAPSRATRARRKKILPLGKIFFSKGAAKNFFAPRSRRRRNLAAPPPLEIFSRSLAGKKV